VDLGLKGLNAVLAGASRGIGRATAEVLAAEGCNVAICARGAEGVEDAVAALSKKGVKSTGSAVDMADGEALRKWVGDAVGELGGCDIFISFASAGGGPASEESWKKNFDLDLMATYRGIQAAMPGLEKSDNGSIVAVSTTAALEEFGGPQAYNAIKAAVITHASNLSQALAPQGIRVNSVSPGPIFIEGGAWDFIKNNMADFYNSTLATIPMGRMGSADEVARAIAFVASPACKFMTGTNVVSDGGITKRVQY